MLIIYLNIKLELVLYLFIIHIRLMFKYFNTYLLYLSPSEIGLMYAYNKYMYYIHLYLIQLILFVLFIYS